MIRTTGSLAVASSPEASLLEVTMRSLLRAGLALGLIAAACKDAAAPGDFSDPVAVSTDMQSVDSVFTSQVYRSISVETATGSEKRSEEHTSELQSLRHLV